MQNEYGGSSQGVSILNARKQNRLAKKHKKSYCEFHGMSAARMKPFELQKWWNWATLWLVTEFDTVTLYSNVQVLSYWNTCEQVSW